MAVHVTALLLLIGLTGLDSVTTISKVSVQIGQSVSIPCLYESKYKGHVKYLCEGNYWRSCTYAVKTNQPSNFGKFLISDDKDQRIFTVTIDRVTYRDTDFWCNVEIKNGPDDGKDFQLSVRKDSPILFVKNPQVTGFIGENVSIGCYHSNTGAVRWCRLGGNCVTPLSGAISGIKVFINSTSSHVFTVTMIDLRPESGGWYWCESGEYQMPVHLTVQEQADTTANVIEETTELINERNRLPLVDLKSLIISLSLLIIVFATLITWLLLRGRQRKAEQSATMKVEEEVTYCEVKHKSKSSYKAADEVTYSSVVLVKKTSNKVEEEDDKVIYSTPVQHNHNI